VEGCLNLISSLFRACFEVFPCLIAGGLHLVQLCPGLILPVLQGFDAFVVFDLPLGLGLVRPCLEQSDLHVPFLQLRIELLSDCVGDALIRKGHDPYSNEVMAISVFVFILLLIPVVYLVGLITFLYPKGFRP